MDTVTKLHSEYTSEIFKKTFILFIKNSADKNPMKLGSLESFGSQQLQQINTLYIVNSYTSHAPHNKNWTVWTPQ